MPIRKKGLEFSLTFPFNKLCGSKSAVSFTALSLTALPAATGLARQAVHTGAAVGSSFLDVLSKLASPLSSSDSTSGDAGTAATADSSGALSSPSGVAGKTQSWCQKFMNWVGQQRAGGDLDITLSLDNLDQPHLVVEGSGVEALEEAIAQDPTWLQEFRELALDRAAEQTSSSPLTLKIKQQSGQIKTQWIQA